MVKQPDSAGAPEPQPSTTWRARLLAGGVVFVRGASLALMAFAISMFAVALPVRYFQLVELRFATHSEAEILRGIEPEGIRQALELVGASPHVHAQLTVAIEAFFAFVFCLVALLARRRVQNEWWATYIAVTLVIFGTATLPTMNALTEVHPVWEAIDQVLNAIAWMLFGLFYYLFPDGRLVVGITRPLGAIWVAWTLANGVFPSNPLDPLLWPPVMAMVVWVVWFGTGVAVQVYRYLRLSTPVQRQQTKWVMYGWTLAFAAAVVTNLPAILFPSLDSPGHPGPIYEVLRRPATYVAILLAPTSLALAILRYRLWDIDLIINRTLVYVPLTALVAGLYTAAVVSSQRLYIALTGERSDAVIVLVTLILATTFASLRGRLQTLVDRWFKEMPDPTRDLRAVGRQVRSVIEVVDQRELAGRFLLEAVTALSAESGAAYLWTGGGWQLVATQADWDEQRTALTMPIEVAGVAFGILSLGPRIGGQPYGVRERQALADTAAVVAAAMRALRT